jgi:hypothetical protein
MVILVVLDLNIHSTQLQLKPILVVE